MFSHFCLTTMIDGQQIEVCCDEETARVLLPIWAKAEPNHTGCTDLRSGQHIACFLPKRFEAGMYDTYYAYEDGSIGESIVTPKTRTHERHYSGKRISGHWGYSWSRLIRNIIECQISAGATDGAERWDAVY